MAVLTTSDIDKKSPRANPSRGYHDYIRTLICAPNYTDEEVKAYANSLRSGMDMWFHVTLNRTEELVTVTINHGCDSGD